MRAGQEKTVETIVPVSGRTVRMQSGSDVRTMTEEAFLIGALAAVIPAEYEPEALKAQTVILRSSCVAGGASGGDRVGEWHDRSSAGEHFSK